MHAYNFIDITGQRYGRYTVLYYDEETSKKKGRSYWICRCDCGTIKSVQLNELRSGGTISCGCYSKEVHSKHNRIEFDQKLNCYRCYLFGTDEYCLFDLEDIDVVQQYCWYMDNKSGYIRSTYWDKESKKSIHVMLHRIIMSKYYNIDGMFIDHINHDRSDNRKLNLRVCTPAQNQRNIRSITSNTGERNISIESGRNKKYALTIKYQGKKYKWRFDTLEEAVKVRDNFYKEHPDEFRYNPEEDYINRNNNIIYPFIFINPEERK